MADFTPASLIGDPAYGRLKRIVIESTGLAYYQDKDDSLAERFFRRMQEHRLRECARYLEILTDPSRRETEMEIIINELTIGETYFFRHREQFDALRDLVFPEIMERRREGRRLRIWSAGCSNGAEAYSLALLLRHEMGARTAGWDVEIIGTDMNRQFLALAREGRYPEWAFRGVPDDLRNACFRPHGKTWEILPVFRKDVTFHYHNLVEHDLPYYPFNIADFDLIVCRNVLIYFSQEAARTAVDKMGKCLSEGGWFVPGYAELGAGLFGALVTVPVAGATLFRKLPVAEKAPALTAHTFKDAVPPALPASKPAGLPARRTPEAPAPPRRLPDLDLLERLCDEGRLREAADHCEACLGADKLNPDLHFRHALILDALGHAAQAGRALRRALYLDPDHVLAHYFLGLFQQKEKDRKGAIRSFRNAHQLLSRQHPSRVFAQADGATAADLQGLIKTHLAGLGAK